MVKTGLLVCIVKKPVSHKLLLLLQTTTTTEKKKPWLHSKTCGYVCSQTRIGSACTNDPVNCKLIGICLE